VRGYEVPDSLRVEDYVDYGLGLPRKDPILWKVLIEITDWLGWEYTRRLIWREDTEDRQQDKITILKRKFQEVLRREGL
jgi:hypothetical protein